LRIADGASRAEAGGAAVFARAAVVRTAAGVDVSDAYRRGAEHALAIVRAHGIRIAILKEGSPSCGNGTIHDGSFSGTRVPGDGVTAALLRANGIRVFSERELDKAAEWLDREEEPRRES
jgi:uncharacterized protein YbbK (DUF523 family)